MPTTTTDAQLVAAHLDGDRAAFAAMYDRYGTTLYDTATAMTRNRDDAADITQDVFVVAAERMSQLRDPTRLKPWLFAILRNEVYRRTGRRQRVVVTDFSEPVAEMTLPSQSADESSDLEYQELAALVRAAASGLDERDHLVLEYSVRQGLEGDDLAAALGVTPQQSYGLVHRMRQRTERSLGAYCVARRGRKDCDELAAILQDWDDQFSVLIRKRVARHIDGCEICEASRRKLAPLALFGAAPAFAAPAELRDRVLEAADRGGSQPVYGFDAPGGFPTAVKYVRRFGIWIALALVALLFLGGTAAFVLAAGDDQLALVDGSSTTTIATTLSGATPGTTTSDGAAATTIAATSSTSVPDTTTSSSTATTDATTMTLAPIVVTLPPTTTTTATTTTTIAVVLPPAATTTPTTTRPIVTATTAPPAATTTMPTTTTTTTITTVAPGALSLSAGSIDFGTTQNLASVTLTNIGGQAIDWVSTTGPAAFRGGASAFSNTPSAGSLGPGESVGVTVTIDRTWPIEGPLSTTRLTFLAPGARAAVDLDGTIARPPTLRATQPPSSICARGVTGAPNPLTASVTVLDESLPALVRFTATSPDGTSAGTVLTENDGVWSGSVGTDLDGDGEPDDGLWTWTIDATDARGNTAAVSGDTTIVPTFC